MMDVVHKRKGNIKTGYTSPTRSLASLSERAGEWLTGVYSGGGGPTRSCRGPEKL